MKLDFLKNECFAIDLFCGGGGLTVGLKNAGFKVVGAVEIEKDAVATFRANHPETHVFDYDVRKIKGEDLTALSPTGKIDLLAGCPPCQGFTSLTAKYKRDDPRNMLINELLRLVKEVRPRAVMMENVPGLAKKGKALLEPVLHELESMGYQTNVQVLQVADYGVPQFRRRLVLLAGYGFKIEMPTPTHSYDGKEKMPWKTVREGIGAFSEPITLNHAKANAIDFTANWNVVRDISDLNLARLRAAQPGKGWDVIPESLRPPCHRGAYKGFSNVYGRMEWDKVSPTITSGCTTPSRGRFGHPEKDRTISVREAATLQTFPIDYVFNSPSVESVCKIIGNALPCAFAERVSAECLRALEPSHHGAPTPTSPSL